MEYVVDTSVVIEKAVTKLLAEKKIKGKLLIPRALVAELEYKANTGQETGLLGLEELQELQKLSKEGEAEIEFIGDRPRGYQMKYQDFNIEVDAAIRDLAYETGATLLTADKIQAKTAEAYGIKVHYHTLESQETPTLEIEKYFDEATMSVHIKERCTVKAKRGSPGAWKLEEANEEKLDHTKVKNMAKEIVEKARVTDNAFVEISRQGSTIVQYQSYRIIIVKPPVSDGWEITAVRPIKKLNLGDYNLPQKIQERIETQARGVIVAGETGSGKSTFAQSVAEYYIGLGKVTKTLESPRDMILSDEVTQYSKNYASGEEIHDILFLSRPDALIFDEMRDTPDFKLFADLRLGGSSVLGVLHAATPIDAVQRFIGRIDTGMIASILDTILFIDRGTVAKVLTVKMMVKVPSGMTEADLARPVVEVRDYETDTLEFEIYSYGEETVVIPVSKTAKKSPAKAMAERHVEREMRKYASKAEAEMVDDHKAIVYVPESEIGDIIGKQGKRIADIEKQIGVRIDVRPIKSVRKGQNIDYDVRERGNALLFFVKQPGTNVDFSIDDNFLFTSTASKRGEIKVSKKSKLGETLLRALNENRRVTLKVVE